MSFCIFLIDGVQSLHQQIFVVHHVVAAVSGDHRCVGAGGHDRGCLLYTSKTAAARAETQPACGEGTGQLPACGALAFPYVAMQGTDPVRYDAQEALRQGTLFPCLDLPFHKELRSRFPQVDGPRLELMALDFAIDELGDVYKRQYRSTWRSPSGRW